MRIGLTTRSLVLASVVAGASVSAQPVPRAQLSEKFRERLQEIARGTNGIVGAAVIDLKTGERFGVNEQFTFPQGSAIKIPILITLYAQAKAGALRLEDRLPVRSQDLTAGSGVAQYFAADHSMLSLHDLAVLMVVLSDNTATNMLIDRLGMATVNATMRSLGLTEIALQRKMIRPKESAAGLENIATPAAAATLMHMIHRCDLPVTPEGCASLRAILEIPKDGALPSALPSDLRVAWKPGSVEGVETAWGLVALPGNPYVVTVMVTYSDAGAATQAIQEVSRAAYEYFHRVGRSSAYGVRVPLNLADSVRKPQ